ncbi:MAG: BREX system P-loop protein BrxC [Ilumatobacter sp.]|uniref:BREX system P-loop protein BrxC n=1 Tax=Ilumatobacter sp. TaxID=1967498 RepID=UPI00391CEC29
MRIDELFSRPIDRKIEEVIKVDDETTIRTEVEEYIPTDHIEEELVDVLNQFQESILNPSETVNIWVSGFFGSGKSSFAKVLGYLIANPVVDGKSVADRFFDLNSIPQARQLLTTIHTQAQTETVLLDLATSPNVLKEGEAVVLPVYRTLLESLGYSRDVTLAELEFALEGPNEDTNLDDFRTKYESVNGRPWEQDRNIITAKNRASRVLHDLDPATYPSADSWSNAAQAPEINANWFADRALEMLKRRRPDKQRLIFIVDEAGQYVARSADRMLGLQGLAEACQKKKGALWLLATSQEKLTDVVDSLEGKQTELAKAVDRFPIRVDLLPSDIDEVTGRRVLDKNAPGATAIRTALESDRNKLTTSVALQSERYKPFSDEDFIRLYPLVPYQLQVLIDAVSARRAQGGAPQTMGGSNRTIIKHTQQLITNPTVGLAGDEVGALVTLDRSYTLLEEVIPTAWRHEVEQAAGNHGADSLHAKIMRVVALCTDVPGVPLTPRNLAVLLHPSTDADPIESQVREALDALVKEDHLREGDEGYRLQTPEQKNWEKERKQIDMGVGHSTRLRKRLVREQLGAVTVSRGRTFKVELSAEREKVTDGDIGLDIREDDDLDALRTTSRAEGNDARIYWAYSTQNDTHEALVETHRSLEMIERYKNAQGDAERFLLQEERKRADRGQRRAIQLLSRDITAGTVVFDGSTEAAPDGDLKPAAEKVLSAHLDKIYPRLSEFTATVKRPDAVQVLKADSIAGLPDCCGSEGLAIVALTAGGPELVTDSGPIETVVSHIAARQQYNEDQNGGQLERHFGAPPFGASPESIQVVLAAAMRAGLLKVVSQAAGITSHTDQRLEPVFTKLPTFRSASFKIAEDTGPNADVRGSVAEWLHDLTGEQIGLGLEALAARGRSTFSPLRQPCTEARSTLKGAGLVVPESLDVMDELLGRVTGADDEIVVETMHERSSDLSAGRSAISELAELVENEMPSLAAARKAQQEGAALEEATEEAKGLGDLLARARYTEDLAKIKAATTSIETAIASKLSTLQSEVEAETSAALQKLRSRFPSVDDSVFTDVTSRLRALPKATAVPILEANQLSVAGLTQTASDELDRLSSTRDVKHVRPAEVWSSPITSVAELDSALDRIRTAVLSELDDDAEVRFR